MSKQQQQQQQQDHSNDYKCRHGGPGELETADKQIFVVTIKTNFDKVHKALLNASQNGIVTPHELLATELTVLEEIITTKKSSSSSSSPAIRSMIDHSLMRLYFSMATTDFLNGKYQEAQVHARIGVYLAMYIRYGNDQFWNMTNQPAELQRITLNDMHTALAQINSTDRGRHHFVKLLKAQTPCNCLK